MPSACFIAKGGRMNREKESPAAVAARKEPEQKNEPVPHHVHHEAFQRFLARKEAAVFALARLRRSA
jgi:hypothetical protein